ncbi:hypothetical protein I8751_13680 [Nostocaceae cyanobacterium CENA357]|uniref:Uncharacterized protein n=1 Tax=Atlanticothrix silvestris CENA357 TaxID=1725252 RepID=A0A8J7L319_9CYAN|nr:hypothetical protein [Atlanticothrix silvestris CENA357]
MYVTFNFSSLDTAVVWIAKNETKDLAERIRKFQKIRQLMSENESNVLICSDDHELSQWILCHESMVNLMIEQFHKHHIQVVNRG